MRVVFDTNIFISALAIPGSLAEKAVSTFLSLKTQPVAFVFGSGSHFSAGA